MDQTTGKRLSELRKAKGLSVEEFAAKLGVKPSAVYGLQSDANKPSFDTLASIVHHFPDVSMDWLLTGSGSMLRDGRSLTPLEAPATKAAPVTQAPQAATAPAGGADPELLKEIRDSRDRAVKDAAYWRALYLAEVRRYMAVDEPHDEEDDATATPTQDQPVTAPGKFDADSYYKAAGINPNTGLRWFGMPQRDGSGNVVGASKTRMHTDHYALLESGELQALSNAAPSGEFLAIGGEDSDELAA